MQLLCIIFIKHYLGFIVLSIFFSLSLQTKSVVKVKSMQTEDYYLKLDQNHRQTYHGVAYSSEQGILKLSSPVFDLNSDVASLSIHVREIKY